MIDLAIRYAPAFLQGLGVTLALAGIVWLAGVVLGTLVGAWAHTDRSVASWLNGLSFVASALPILVVLMWLHFPAQALLGVVINPFITTIVALSFVNVLLVGDTVTRTLDGLPEEWSLAGRTAGLSEQKVFRDITLPLAARQILGPVLIIQLTMLHSTLFASLISVDELFRTVQRINALEYKPIELYTLLAVLFFIICAPIQWIAVQARRRYSQDTSLR